MSLLPELRRELCVLLGRLRDGELDEAQLAQLDELVGGNVDARRLYLDYVDLCASLHWARRENDQRRGARGEGRGMAGSPASDGEAGFGVRDSGFGIQGSKPFSAGAAVEHPVGAAVQLPHQLDFEPQIPEPPFPTLSTTNYPLPTSDFVGSWAFSYMVATVIMGVAILGFWAYKITHYQHIAEAPSQSVPSDAVPEMVFVGRITGMVDVKWSDDPRYLPPPDFAHVPLGRKYKLDSGLMEITYDSGAKVILEGPCTYEVESTAGGYLSLGKLTARVETVDGKGSRSKVQGSISTSLTTSHQPLATNSNPQSLIPNPFVVRTPTAVVTDLGTEFGVEVDEAGVTESHVFQGKVEVRLTGGGREARTIQLGANESARVQPDKDAKDRLVIVRGAAAPAGFVCVGQLASLAEERQLKPLRRWQAFSEELRKRDDLLAYYDFQPDESDHSVLRNRAATGAAFDGRIGDAPWVAGRFPGKYALRFGWRGSGVRVNVPVECRQLTLAAWVKLDYLPSARAGQYHSSLLMSDGCWGDRPGQMHWQIIQEGAMMFSVYGSSARAVGPPPPGFSGGLRRDQWHFVAATCDLAAGKTSIYLDGALVGEQVCAVPDSAAIKLGGTTIGDWDDPSMSPDGRQQLRGRMEELMVFRAALSPAEIRRLFELQQPEHTREQR